jgi:alpha-mannosidase
MEHLEFHWDSNSEAMIWTEKGEVVHGLTGGGERIEWILPRKWYDGETRVFYVEMACNGMFGNAPGGDSIQPPDPNRYFQLSKADIVGINLDARVLFYDFWEISDASREFPQDSWQAHQALQVCNRIMDTFIAGDGSLESIRKGRKIAQEFIGDAPLDDLYDDNEDAFVTGIGHCHIDTCWLWPWAETKRKVARSWSTQCDLIDRYPELRFCASQAQQYKWLEQHYPSVFDRVKKKVKEGTFQPIGGSWVEHDTNLPSGESLVRQFLYGQRYFESRFGKRCETFWLPDTFGYSTQLPQISQLAGMSRFFTQKLSWNNINSFPHTTFNWVALDGTQVLCHMTPAETYTAEADFGDLKRSVSQHKSLDQDKSSLLVFGKGDGGGGPTWGHLEKLRRCRGISDTVGLLPKLKMGESVDDFFAQIEKKVEKGTIKLPTWYGELYFELHRGTYTTQANNKRNNRFSEIMLRDVEFLATWASTKDIWKASTRWKYPKVEIDFMWESVLLCQFHDCLPGSSIEMCYDDSDKLYATVMKTGEELITETLSVLGYTTDLKADSKIVAINTLPWSRTELVKFPAIASLPSYGLAHGGPGAMEVRPMASAYPASIATIEEVGQDEFVLENANYKVTVKNGVITSIGHVIGQGRYREVIPKGKKANQLVIFDDKPLYWQAWDVEVYHLDSRKELVPNRTTIVESGPHRVSLQIETKISEKSWIKTTMSLPAVVEKNTLNPLEFESEIEWQETMKFLKVEFPVDIVNTEASYETQFGIVRRPTHYNTTWDMAKFEVCSHKWADLSEWNFGVTILNDSKYGFATVGNVMRLSLLRAPKAPDAHADMGRHRVRYGLLTHEGALGPDTVKAAFNFNHPLKLVSPKTLPPPQLPKIFIDEENVIIDTIKRGEDDWDVSTGDLPSRPRRSIIIRMYEALGGGTTDAMLSWNEGLPVENVLWCNLLEDDLQAVEGFKPEMFGVTIKVKPFEIVTIRLVLQDD